MEQMTCHVGCQLAPAAISASTAPRFDRIDLAKWLAIAQENCVLRLTEAGAMKCEVYFALAAIDDLRQRPLSWSCLFEGTMHRL
jgi:hypothetical protein